MESTVLNRSFHLGTKQYRDGSKDTFRGNQYFYVLKEPHHGSPTVGYLYFEDAVEEARRLHNSHTMSNKTTCRMVVHFRDELSDSRYPVAKTEWTVKGVEVIKLLELIPKPYGEDDWSLRGNANQPEITSKMQFSLQNPHSAGLTEVPELFWTIYSPPVTGGAVNNATLMPQMGYTEEEEANKEAAILHTKLLGQRPIYLLKVEKIAHPVAPQVRFEKPKPTTAGALTSTS